MDKDRFGIWLNEKRKQKGMTQAQLAEELNYTKQMISKWELGKGTPRDEIIYRIEKLFGPIPEELKDLREYIDFKALNEVTQIEEYKYMFEKLLDGLEIDATYSNSVKSALLCLLWANLFVFHTNFESEKQPKQIFRDWLYYSVYMLMLISDRDGNILENYGKEYSFNSSAKIKKKLEVILEQVSDQIESSSKTNSLKQDDLKALCNTICFSYMEQLYNILPDTDTDWKSSFISAAYKLHERIIDVYYLTSGLRKMSRPSDQDMV